MIAMRIHPSPSGAVLAACDEDLLGKSFSEGHLRLTVSQRFYDGERASVDVLKERMLSAHILNLVGRKTVGAGVQMGYVDPSKIIEIEGIPHAQTAVE